MDREQRLRAVVNAVVGRPNVPISLQFDGPDTGPDEQRLAVAELSDREIHASLQDAREQALIRGEVNGGDGSIAFWVKVQPTLHGLRYLGQWPQDGKTRVPGPWDDGLWGRVARPVLAQLAEMSSREREVIWRPTFGGGTSPLDGLAPEAYWDAVNYLLEARLIDARPIDGGLADVRLSLAGDATLSDRPRDPLDEAETDLRQGNLVQAAALVGNVLDARLKALATDRELDLRDERGREKLLGPLNDELKGSGAYSEIDRASIQAWLAIRNAAVHDRAEYIDAVHVQTMIEGVRGFLARLAAEQPT